MQDLGYMYLMADAAVEYYMGELHPREPDEEIQEDVCVVHVRAGSEHQALLYLLRSVSRHFQLDDILPEVPEDIANHRYIVLQPPRGEWVGH